jgi:hypothetical protein
MTHEFQPRPLPDVDEYTAASEAVQGKMNARNMNAKVYLSSFGLELDSTKAFARTAAQLANSVELTDESTGAYADPERRRGRATYLGALGGYAILREIYGVSLPASDLFESLPPIAVDINYGDSGYNINSLHESLMRLGREGLLDVGKPTVDRFSEWSGQAVSRPEYRPTFVAIAGLVIVAGTAMQTKRIEQFHTERIQEHIEAGAEFDWDRAWLDLKTRED